MNIFSSLWAWMRRNPRKTIIIIIIALILFVINTILLIGFIGGVILSYRRSKYDIPLKTFEEEEWWDPEVKEEKKKEKNITCDYNIYTEDRIDEIRSRNEKLKDFPYGIKKYILYDKLKFRLVEYPDFYITQCGNDNMFHFVLRISIGNKYAEKVKHEIYKLSFNFGANKYIIDNVFKISKLITTLTDYYYILTLKNMIIFKNRMIPISKHDIDILLRAIMLKNKSVNHHKDYIDVSRNYPEFVLYGYNKSYFLAKKIIKSMCREVKVETYKSLLHKNPTSYSIERFYHSKYCIMYLKPIS